MPLKGVRLGCSASSCESAEAPKIAEWRRLESKQGQGGGSSAVRLFIAVISSTVTTATLLPLNRWYATHRVAAIRLVELLTYSHSVHVVLCHVGYRFIGTSAKHDAHVAEADHVMLNMCRYILPEFEGHRFINDDRAWQESVVRRDPDTRRIHCPHQIQLAKHVDSTRGERGLNLLH